MTTTNTKINNHTNTVLATAENIEKFLVGNYGATLADWGVDAVIREMKWAGLFDVEGLTFNTDGEKEDHKGAWRFYRLSNGDAFSVSPLRCTGRSRPFYATAFNRGYADQKSAEADDRKAYGRRCAKIARQKDVPWDVVAALTPELAENIDGILFEYLPDEEVEDILWALEACGINRRKAAIEAVLDHCCPDSDWASEVERKVSQMGQNYSQAIATWMAERIRKEFA